MKPKEFADALARAANLLPLNDATQLRILAELFASSRTATVAATLTKLRKARAFAPIAGEPAIGSVLMAIAPLTEFVSLYGKPAYAKDLQSVAAFLQGFSQAGVRSFVDDAIGVLSWTTPPPPILNEEVVERHLRRLESTLGNDPAFSAAYRDLDDDPDVGKLEIAALAKRFADASAKSRPAALNKIRARHLSLLSSRAKSESRAGRSAG